MHFERLIQEICGYDDDGTRVRLYFEEPNPLPSLDRQQGVRSGIFRDLTSEGALAFRSWVYRNRAWECMKVAPPYSRERGIAALRLAFSWQWGPATPLYDFAAGRTIRDEDHREALRQEVQLLIGGVLENPNPGNPNELPGLRLLAEVIATAPAGTRLASRAELHEE
jgi:hypothetical protein